MEFSVLIGYVALILALLFGIVFTDGGINFDLLNNFINGPSIFIAIGGTLFTLMAAFPFKTFRYLPRHLKMVFGRNQKDPYEYVEIITELSKELLGENMSVALITTFYGSLLANCFFIPMSNKIELAQEREMVFKELIVEGIISIKEGENPKFIREKLMNFLEDHEKRLDGKKSSTPKELER